MSEEPQRWSGFASQSPAWQQGYEWAHSRGPVAHLGCIEAEEELGYDFDSPEAEEFDKGADFAHLEQSGS